MDTINAPVTLARNTINAPVTLRANTINAPVTTARDAYQLAVAGGFEGSREQWLAGLAGAPGAPGAPGAQGAPGTTSWEGITDKPAALVAAQAAGTASIRALGTGAAEAAAGDDPRFCPVAAAGICRWFDDFISPVDANVTLAVSGGSSGAAASPVYTPLYSATPEQNAFGFRWYSTSNLSAGAGMWLGMAAQLAAFQRLDMSVRACWSHLPAFTDKFDLFFGAIGSTVPTTQARTTPYSACGLLLDEMGVWSAIVNYKGTLQDSTGTTIYSSATPAGGVFHVLRLVWDKAAGTLEFHVNGVLAKTIQAETMALVSGELLYLPAVQLRKKSGSNARQVAVDWISFEATPAPRA